MMISRIIILVSAIFFLQSCEEIIMWPDDNPEMEGLVVEAIITDEYKKQEIRLTKPIAGLNDEPPAVSGAYVRVSDGQHDIPFHESSSIPGIYLSEIEFAVNSLDPYYLKINYGDSLYLAQARGEQGMAPRSFQFLSFGETDSVYIPGLGVEYSEKEQAMYEFIVDWSHLDPDGKNRAKMVHYVFSSINIGQIFGPDQEQVVFPRGSIVIQKKYSLSPDFAEYLRSLVIETQYKGGYFDESSGNLTTNISNGAYGYFAVCAVQSDTVVVE